MTGASFVDPNVFVYACNPPYRSKKTTAETLPREPRIDYRGRTSAAAVEHYAAVIRRLNG